MGIDNTRDLFLYELGETRNFHIAGAAMLSAIAHRIQNRELSEFMHAEEGSRQGNLDRINECLQEFGASPLEHAVPTVEALRQRFQTFVGLSPGPAELDIFVLGTSLRFMYLALVAYKELIELAQYMGESRCRDILRTILVDKEERTRNLERHCRKMTSDDVAAPHRA